MAQDNENCAREALNIFKHKLNLKDITVIDIEVAHRVGKPLRGKPQSLIVKFCNIDCRHKVLASRRKLKGTGFIITEDLTQMNQKLLNRARLDPAVKNAWS